MFKEGSEEMKNECMSPVRKTSRKHKLKKMIDYEVFQAKKNRYVIQTKDMAMEEEEDLTNKKCCSWSKISKTGNKMEIVLIFEDLPIYCSNFFGSEECSHYLFAYGDLKGVNQIFVSPNDDGSNLFYLNYENFTRPNEKNVEFLISSILAEKDNYSIPLRDMIANFNLFGAKLLSIDPSLLPLVQSLPNTEFPLADIDKEFPTFAYMSLRHKANFVQKKMELDCIVFNQKLFDIIFNSQDLFRLSFPKGFDCLLVKGMGYFEFMFKFISNLLQPNLKDHFPLEVYIHTKDNFLVPCKMMMKVIYHRKEINGKEIIFAIDNLLIFDANIASLEEIKKKRTPASMINYIEPDFMREINAFMSVHYPEYKSDLFEQSFKECLFRPLNTDEKKNVNTFFSSILP